MDNVTYTKSNAELERERLLEQLETMDYLPEQAILSENREGELSRSKYIKDQGGIDIADHTFSEAQAILQDALQNGKISSNGVINESISSTDKQQLQHAHKIVADRKEFLRGRAVPSNRLENQRRFQNMAKQGASNDPLAHDYLPKGQNYAADHIVSFEKIWDMPGFKDLGIKDQLAIVRDGANFQPLSKALNSSKREKGYSGDNAWTGLKGHDMSNDPVYKEAARIEQEVMVHLQDRINEMNNIERTKPATSDISKFIELEEAKLKEKEELELRGSDTREKQEHKHEQDYDQRQEQDQNQEQTQSIQQNR